VLNIFFDDNFLDQIPLVVPKLVNHESRLAYCVITYNVGGPEDPPLKKGIVLPLCKSIAIMLQEVVIKKTLSLIILVDSIQVNHHKIRRYRELIVTSDVKEL
jgi:hypothetical protein